MPLAPEWSVASFARAAALARYARASVTCSAAMSPYWQVLLSRALARSGLRKSLRGAWEGEVRRSGERMDAGMGVFFLRTKTELSLKSRRVLLLRLLKSGLRFRFPYWTERTRKWSKSKTD